MDLERKQFKKDINGRDLVVEISKLAEQTNAAVLATYGETSVLATVVMGSEDTDTDYMPLTVDYEEKFYAAGKILGGRYVKREGKPTEEAILSGRVIDRTIRPLFDKRIRRPIQVVATILSYDEENDPDFPALVAASTALAISDIPWGGPVAGASVSKIGNEFVINPKKSDLVDKEVFLNGFFAGTDTHLNMLELAGYEAGEKDVVEAGRIAMETVKELVKFQRDIVGEVGKKKVEIEFNKPSEEFIKEVLSALEKNLADAVYVKDKKDRSDKVSLLKKDIKSKLEEKFENDIQYLDGIFEDELDKLVHKNILESEKRPDGRALDEIRELHAETSLFPRTHGSALFVRGNTQALAFTTLGSPGDSQLLETVESQSEKRFMLHYNFPPFSVGEARSFRGPGRRDIGHGALAEKAISPLMPGKESFPYTVRVVSEVLSSNGSSSMATVSASSLSLMDAGVPIKSPAAGIAMGLVAGDGGKYKILTDIQGPEDHYGDMDLKVAGTRAGITAMQMDVKIQGITIDILEEAIKAANVARNKILDVTDKVLSKERQDLSKYAPRILTITIDKSKIGEVIGPGGKVINEIIEKTGVVSIDIDDDGTVFVTSKDKDSAEKAISEVKAIVSDLEIGSTIDGVVAKILEFGAIVEFPGGKSGMIHISELKDGFVKEVKDVLKEGDAVKVKVLKVENGKTSLSLKQAKE